MRPLVIGNARVVLPNAVLNGGGVFIEDGLIRAVLEDDLSCRSEVANGAEWIDAADGYLTPGLIDLHNDALEFEINPRPGASLPLAFAFDNLERRLAAGGVTTEFHAVSFMERPRDRRSIGGAVQRAKYISSLQDGPPRAVDHQVLHRIDVWHPDALDLVFASLEGFSVRYASLNDHTPGQGQYRDLDAFFKMREAYGNSPDEAEIRERMRVRGSDTETVARVYDSVGAARRRLDVVLASHDDDSIEKVESQLALGATVNEFPVTIEVAEHARAQGMSVVVGAPNIVRGGSQSGNLAASELLTRGLANVISADYHAPSLLPAAFHVFNAGWATLPEAVAMVTLNPARAVGLHDRGAVALGLRADLAIVRMASDGFPRVDALFRGGRTVFAYEPFSHREAALVLA